jgi:hypothetical protein
MLLRSFMTFLLAAGVLATVQYQTDNQPTNRKSNQSIKVEEYTFEPMFINVPVLLNDAGLD